MESRSVFFFDYRKQFQPEVLAGTTIFDTKNVFCNIRLPLIYALGIVTAFVKNSQVFRC